MLTHQIKPFGIICGFLLLILSTQLPYHGAIGEINYMLQHDPKALTTSLNGSVENYEDYVIAALEFLLNNNWDEDTGHFLGEVGRMGTAISLDGYLTVDQAMSIKALAYMYPKVENQVLRVLSQDRLASATNSFIRDFWDEDGAVLAGDPQEPNSNTMIRYTLNQFLAASALTAADNQLNVGSFRSQAQKTVDFALQELWDETNGGFFFRELNGSIDSVKDTQSQAVAINGLLSVFDQFGTEIYLQSATQTLDFALTYLWDTNHTAFYFYSTHNGTVSTDGLQKRTVTQGLMLSALSAMYRQLNNELYLDYINQTISFSMAHLWDPENGGFFASTSEDGSIPDETLSKASNKQFYMILGLLDAYEIYQELSPEYANYLLNIITTTLEFVLSTLWDPEFGGFYIAMDMMGEIQNKNKFAISQALGTVVLQKILDLDRPLVSRLQWNPLAPSPTDVITIAVSISGMNLTDAIMLNYWFNETSDPLHSVSMIERAQNRFEVQIGPFPHGTRVSFKIVFTDSNGEEYVGNTNMFLVTEDRIGPAVHLRELTPSSPSAADPIEITVHTIDDRPHISVKRVVINYRIDQGDWEVLDLLPIDEEHFNVTIGPFPSNALLEFYFTGYDAFGNAADTGVTRIEIAPEQRTIVGFEWLGVLIALISWLRFRYYRASRPRHHK